MALSEIPYYIIVDNNDNNVTVTGSNKTKGPNRYEEYDGTDIAITGEHTQVTFDFWGTSVSEYLTMEAGVPDTLNFTLDDLPETKVVQQVPPNTFSPHWPIYNSTQVPNGPHTLVSSIQESGVITGQGSAYMVVDYFIVTRPAGANVTGLTLLYDDAHPAFQYSGQWQVQSGEQEAFLNMNWTLHDAVSEGATATFTFNGSSIKIYASIREGSTGSIASFAIDSGPASTASVPNPLPSPTQNVSANQMLYDNSDFNPGTHSLVMTALGSNMFYFDYLTVTGVDTTDSTTGDPGTITSAAVVTSTSTRAGNGATASTSPSPSEAQRTLSTGIVVAIVIASVAVISMIVGAAILISRHRRRLKERKRPRSVIPMSYTDMTSSPVRDAFVHLPDYESLRAPVVTSGSHGPANEFTVDDVVYVRPTKLRVYIEPPTALSQKVRS